MHVLTQVPNSPQVSSCAASTLTQERLKHLLNYDPETGFFTWNTPPHNRLKGKRAGTVKIIRKKKTNYRAISIAGREYQEHRLAFLWMTGALPEKIIDHADLDGTNNKWSNLREASFTQNKWNCPANARNKIGIKGVRRRPSGRFEAQIKVNKKNVYLGSFGSAEEAHAAYCKAANELHGEFARAA